MWILNDGECLSDVAPVVLAQRPVLMLQNVRWIVLIDVNALAGSYCADAEHCSIKCCCHLTMVV